MTEIITAEAGLVNPHVQEERAIVEALGLVRGEIQSDMLPQYEALVRIVAQFTRVNPNTGESQLISPKRIAAIPAITARYCALQRPARGELSLEEIEYHWRTNMPTNDGTRHPDQLFNCAQMNFGSDEPLDAVEAGIMQEELERRDFEAAISFMLRSMATQDRWEVPLDSDRSAGNQREVEEFVHG